MNFSGSSRSGEGGMLDSLKSRFGFGDAQQGAHTSRGAHSRADRTRFDDLDDDQDDFGFDDDYDLSDYGNEFDAAQLAAYGPDYDEGAQSAYVPAGSQAPRSSARAGRSFPDLVSRDDVRAHAQTSERARREAASGDSYSSQATGPMGRVTVSDRLTPEQAQGTYNQVTAAPQAPSSAQSFDPYDAYARSMPATHAPTRSLSVLRPQSYADAEQVAKTVKAGDVMVLSLRDASDDLSKRVLDFSFGVACALGANVDSLGRKVFVITTGAALSEAERQALSNQGVL